MNKRKKQRSISIDQPRNKKSNLQGPELLVIIPREVLVYIFSYFDLKELIHLKRVSRTFNNLVLSTNIWTYAVSTHHQQDADWDFSFNSSYSLRHSRELFHHRGKGLVASIDRSVCPPYIRSGHFNVQVKNWEEADVVLTDRGYAPIKDSISWRYLLLSQHSTMTRLCGGAIPVQWEFDRFVPEETNE